MICVFIVLILIANDVDDIIRLNKEIKVIKKNIIQLQDILQHWDTVSEYMIWLLVYMAYEDWLCDVFVLFRYIGIKLISKRLTIDSILFLILHRFPI